MLIYKYLLESGLKHTAFSLFNEANLEKVDINSQKINPKMLINLLEKSLIFNQIETHMYKEEAVDCKESFELLVPHQCRTAELKKQELAGKINQLNHDLEAVLNEDEITNDTIQKIKVTNDKIAQIVASEKLDLLALYGENDAYVSLWKIKVDNHTNKASLTPNGVIEFLNLESSKDDFLSIQWNDSGEYLLLAFRDGRLFFFDENAELKNFLRVEAGLTNQSITWSPYSSELLSLVYETHYMIINPVQGSVIKKEERHVKSLIWQNSKNYIILTNEDMIYLYEVGNDLALQAFVADEGTETIKLSGNSLFLASFSRKTNSIKVWTMTSKDFIYSITDPHSISNFVWNSSEEDSANFFNVIVILFHHTAKIFDIEYGDIRSTIELDEKRAPIISALFYHKDTHLVLTQEDGTISVYPMFSIASANKKAQTIPSTGEVQQLVKYGVTNGVGISKNDLLIVKLKKILQH